MHRWQDDSDCVGMDPSLFFDTYENDPHKARAIDKRCRDCPVNRLCFNTGVAGDEWGVWGGIYLQDGKISEEYNKHKTNDEWSDTWISLTMEKE